MLFQWTSRWHVHYTSLHMQLNICNAVNSSWLESPPICCCTNLYMSWTKFSRTKFYGLKEIICCRWWKASKNYQACQISKGNWCCVDSYSKVEGPFSKWLLFLQIQGIFYAIVDHKKQFMDIFVGMPSSMNDSKVLHLSSVYRNATLGDLFHEENLHHGINPT